MQIMIDNALFDYNTGCKVLKAKHRECPFPELADFWDEIIPMDFQQVAAIENLESRRVALLYLGIESIVEQAGCKMLASETVKKTTKWVSEDGSIIDHDFEDTYELWTVKRGDLLPRDSWQDSQHEHFIRMKDTSTDRQYLVWVDYNSVAGVNSKRIAADAYYTEECGPIACIAWTIQTTVAKGNIKSIIRQGCDF